MTNEVICTWCSSAATQLIRWDDNGPTDPVPACEECGTDARLRSITGESPPLRYAGARR